MKKFYSLFFLIFFLLLIAYSQSKKDIDLLNREAESLLNKEPQKSLTLATKAKVSAEKNKYNNERVKAISVLGIANYKVDNFDKAWVLMVEAEELSAQIKDTSQLSFCRYWIGNLYLNQAEYSKALDMYQSALLLAEKIDDKKNIARCLDGKASIYESLGEDERAIDYYLQAYKIAQQNNFKEWYGTLTFELANFDYKKRKLEEAMKKYKQAITLSEETGNLNNKASCLQQIASIYYEQNKLKESMQNIQQAMDIFKQTGAMISFSYSRLLMSFILLKNQKYDMAIDLAQKSLAEAKNKKEIELEKNSAEALYYAYLSKGDKTNALEYHIKFHQLSEEKHTKDLAKRLTQLELQSNFEKERQLEKAIRDRQDAERDAEFEKQNLIKKASLIGIGLLTIIAAISIYAFSQKQKDTRLIDLEKRKSDELLLNILPAEVVNELKVLTKETKNLDLATFLFADIKNITTLNDKFSKENLAEETANYIKHFDEIIYSYDIKKIKTQEDIYLCIAAKPNQNQQNALDIVTATNKIQNFVKNRKQERSKTGELFLELSIGIYTGPLVAGIVGVRKYDCDIWGDAVNMAARMEQYGESGKTIISSFTYELVKDKVSCTYRGKTEDNHKNTIDMYSLDGLS